MPAFGANGHQLRRLHFLALMLVIGACDDGSLTNIDGGSPEDAGIPSDANGSDAGFEADAGDHEEDGGVQSDAGDADAGVVDAGPPPCVFADNPPVPFVCEGDEDWCDPLGDATYAEGDILAMWSRIEGDEWVVDVRFSAAPFRLIPYEGLILLFDDAPPGAPTAGEFSLSVEDGANHVSGSLAVFIDSRRILGGPYPPDIFASRPIRPLAPCTMFLLGTVTPLVEMRLPVAWLVTTDGESIDYAVGSQHAPIPLPLDVSWIGTAAFTRSVGGAPDDLSDVVSSCTIGCPETK